MEYVYNCMGHDLKIPNVVDSSGIYVIDDKGKRYTDLEAGVWCTALGHKNERINRVIAAQTDRLMHAGFCYSNEILDQSAAAVLEVTGFGTGKCVFLCSGSEAIEISRQIAKHLTGKTLSMTLHDSYLGAYSSVTDRSHGWYLFNWEGCRTCRDRNSCDSECPSLGAVPKDISDFVFEPGSSSGFVRFPPKTLIQNLVRRVKSQGGKVIANEVTTGAGRTGRWFGYQHYDIEPDMVAIGKGIGNGYPVSVAAIRDSITAELERKPFKYGQSHMNDPLGAAIVHEVVQIITERGLIAEAERKGRVLLDQLQLLTNPEIMPEVRGRGLMVAIDLINEQTTEKLYDELISRGYIVGNRRTAFRIDPPLIIGDDDLKSFLDTLSKVLKEPHITTF
jgi:acetylornithine/N-succinyldiaminopimelate aminotransferase